MQNAEQLKTAQISAFLKASDGIEFKGQNRAEKYAWTQQVLVPRICPPDQETAWPDSRLHCQGERIQFATSDASDTNVPCHRNRKTAVLSTAAVQANLHVGGRDGAGESGSGPREAAWTCTRLWLIPKYRAINSNWPNSGKKSRTWTATLRLLKLQRKQTPHHIAVKLRI